MRDHIISYHCSGLLSELSDQICVGTAKAIRGGADNGHAMARIRHVSNDGVIARSEISPFGLALPVARLGTLGKRTEYMYDLVACHRTQALAAGSTGKYYSAGRVRPLMRVAAGQTDKVSMPMSPVGILLVA
jgi:hypothetical protein